MPPSDQNFGPINIPKKPTVPAAEPAAPTIVVPSSHVVLDFAPREIAPEPPQPAFSPLPHTTMTPSQVPPVPIAPTSSAAAPLGAAPAPSVSPSAVSAPAYTPVAPPLSRAEQVAMYTKDLADLTAKKEALRAEIATLSVEQKKEEALLAPLLKKEDEANEAYEKIEKAEADAVTPAEKRKFETERFQQETKRQAFLVEKFAAMEKSEKIKETIAQKEAIYQSVVAEETQLKTRVHEVEVEAKRKAIHDELEGVVKTRVDAESKVEQVAKERATVQGLLNETIEKEKSIEENAHATAAAMSTAASLTDARSLAEARAKLEAERHQIEEARWKAEDDLMAVDAKVAEATASLEAIKAHEAELFAKLQTIK